MTETKHPNQSRIAVVLTALQCEFKAVSSYLDDLERVTHPSGTVYHKSDFVRDSEHWTVVVCQIGPGNANAATEAERAISYFKPSVVGFVGVAGGIKDVKLGDVVVATKVYGYESGKEASAFLPRADVYRSSYSLESLSRAIANEGTWHRSLRNAVIPAAHVGPIAAGEKVVANSESETLKFIRGTYSDAVAVEMEGLGFLAAAHANPQVSAVVVRGISDLLDHKEKSDRAGSQQQAADNAAAFFMELLSGLVGDQAPNARARAGLTKTAVLSASPISKQEILYTNLVRLRKYPQRVFLATTPLRTKVELWDTVSRLRPQAEGSIAFREDKIYSFEDLREFPWSETCDRGTVEVIETDYWALSSDEQQRWLFVELMKAELRRYMFGRGIRLNKDLDLFFFARHDGPGSRSHRYNSKIKVASRDVVREYYANDDPRKLKYIRHFALHASFKYLAEVWYLALNPSYIYTRDGRTPMEVSPKLTSGMKNQEGNQAVLGQIVMWSRILEYDALFEDSAIGFDQLTTGTLGRGIVDEAWTAPKTVHTPLREAGQLELIELQ